MKKKIWHTLLVCLFLAGAFAGPAGAQDYGAANFSALGRKVQPPPAGHRPGKDNGPGTGTHNTGEDCGLCHRPQGRAANYVFTMAGTFYEDRAARKTVAGGEVMLQDIDGKVISMTSNGAGNFWTYAPIASNPRSLASGAVGVILTFPAAHWIETALTQFFPVFHVSARTVYLELLTAAVVGAVAAVFPAWRGATLRIAEGLRRIG